MVPTMAFYIYGDFAVAKVRNLFCNFVHFHFTRNTIIGSKNADKVNFLTASFIAPISFEPVLIAMAIQKGHYSTQGLLEEKVFSINIPSVSMLETTDYIGIKSGKDVDKSNVFKYFAGEVTGAPIIKDAPLAFECKVIDVITDKSNSHNIIIGEIVEGYAEEAVLNDKKSPDITKLDPIILSGSNLKYYKISTEQDLGGAFNVGLKLK